MSTLERGSYSPLDGFEVADRIVSPVALPGGEELGMLGARYKRN